MARNHLPPSSNPSDDSDPEAKDESDSDEEDEQQVTANLVNHNDDDETDEESDDESEPINENKPDNDKEEEEEEESSGKTASPVRQLNYESDADSGKSLPTPSPSPSDYIMKENSEAKNKKRAAESEPVEKKSVVKKSKKENGSNVVIEKNDKGKRPSQRIWGLDDELKIVKGMLEYKEKFGVDFNSNLDSFYRFIKDLLNAVVDKNQLVNKIRKLREKYRDIAAKEANGEGIVLKNHEEELHEVSKKVWGEKGVGRSKQKSKKDSSVSTDTLILTSKSTKENNVVSDAPMLVEDNTDANGGSLNPSSQMRKSAKKQKVVQMAEFHEADSETKDFVTIPMPGLVHNSFYEKGRELVEKAKLDAMDEKWTKYQMEAAELYLKKIDLMKEQTKLFLDALKSNP